MEFCHLVVQDNNNQNKIDSNAAISETKKRAKEVIFIETMGTNVETPIPPGEKLSNFYHELVNNGFTEYIIETDYIQ